MITTMALERFGRIVDVGGGTGAFARRVAAALPDTDVVLFDRPEVVAMARVSNRPRGVPGDFFREVPAADAYVYRFVIHDWPDVDAVRIFARCRAAMRRESRIFVVEVFLPDGATPSIAKTHDVNMLVLTGGRERTLAEYRALLDAAGLEVVTARATARGLSVIEARARD
jgi:hypothetical protein